MAKFYTVALDDLYLSSDGSETGVPCKLDLDGADQIRQTVAGNVDFRADGSPVVSTIPFVAGKPISIEILSIPSDVLDDVVSAMNDALENETAISLVATGDTGDFTVDVLPDPREPFRFGDFKNGRVRSVRIRFVSV